MKLLLLLASLSLAQVKNPDTYTYLTINEANSLDPAWAYDSAGLLVIQNVYENLFAFEGASTDRLVPRLAAQVPTRDNGLVSEDGLTYRIPIRQGVRFHDGKAFTPDDARYSILRFMLYERDAGPSALLSEPLLGRATTRDASGAPDPEAYEAAVRAVRVEGQSLILRLPKPYAPLLSILASWCPMVSRIWTGSNGGWDGREENWRQYANPQKESSPYFARANGTGPFRLERWDRRTQQLVLSRNDSYWRKPAALSRVVIKSVKEFGTRKLALQAGDADNILADRASFSQLKALPGVKVLDDLATINIDQAVYFTFDINTTANPYIGSGKLDGDGIPADFFSDLNVRKGFAHAFDYAGFIKDVNLGKGRQPAGCVPPGLLGHEKGKPAYRFDAGKARDYLKKAWGGQVWEKGFTLTLAYGSGNTQRQIICQILKKGLESLNPKFKVDVRPIEWPTFLDALRASKLPLFVQGWSADYPDPHSFAFPLLHSQGGFPKLQRWKNPEADRLVEAAIAETDPAKRKELYAKLQKIERDEVPHLLVLNSAAFRVQRGWVRGFVHNPLFPEAPHGAYFHSLRKE